MGNPGVVMVAVSVYGTGNLIGQTAPSGSVENILVQSTGVGLALATGVWLLRRYDARSDVAQSRADRLLKAEQDAHRETMRLLGECSAARQAAEEELRRRLNRREDPDRPDRRGHDRGD